MATKSTFANMLKPSVGPKKVLDADDMAEPNEGSAAEEAADAKELKVPKAHARGVRSPKAGKTKSTYENMLKK